MEGGGGSLVWAHSSYSTPYGPVFNANHWMTSTLDCIACLNNISKYVDICLKSGKSDNVCKKTFYNNNLFEIILGILRNVLIRNLLNHQIVEPCTHEGELRVIMCIN